MDLVELQLTIILLHLYIKVLVLFRTGRSWWFQHVKSEIHVLLPNRLGPTHLTWGACADLYRSADLTVSALYRPCRIGPITVHRHHRCLSALVDALFGSCRGTDPELIRKCLRIWHQGAAKQGLCDMLHTSWVGGLPKTPFSVRSSCCLKILGTKTPVLTALTLTGEESPQVGRSEFEGKKTCPRLDGWSVDAYNSSPDTSCMEHTMPILVH